MAESDTKRQKGDGSEIKEGLLVGIGNPLLDISAVCDEAFLAKYELKPDSAILAEDKHQPMYKDMIDHLDVEYIPGGATLNSMRIAQWILPKPNVISYFGCIGDDAYGKTLVEKACESGVNIKPQVDSEHSTGTCGVLLTGTQRSLVANLAAANHFKRTHFDNKDNWELVENAEFLYVGGFFLTVSPESILEMAKAGCEKNKYVMMNLSAEFLCMFFDEPMMQVFPYLDILFANETEAIAFSKQQNFGTDDVKEIALKAAALDKMNKSRPRMVVFTQGAKSTLVAFDGKITEYPIIPIEKDKIVDTNGAGDSFVGGFLSQLVQGRNTDRCVQVGHYAANYIIQQSGVTMNHPANLPE